MALVPFLVYAQHGPTSERDTGGAPSEVVAAEDVSVEGDRVDESTLILGQPSPATTDSGVSPFTFWDLLRMVLVLAIVVGIIYLVFHLLKRASNGKYADSDLIRIVGAQTLPGNRAIYLVQVGTQIFMVGAGSESVTLLGEITEKETVDAMILAAGASGDGPRRSFGDLVGSIIRGTQGASLDLMREQRQRLQRLRQ